MAGADDTAPETGRADFVWLFFRLRGRLGRKAYALAALLLIVWQTFVFYRIGLAEEGSAEIGIWTLALFLTFPLVWWATFALSVKRLHDLGKPAALAILQFIPMLALLMFIVLCIIPGQSGPNQYGEAPNSSA